MCLCRLRAYCLLFDPENLIGQGVSGPQRSTSTENPLFWEKGKFTENKLKISSRSYTWGSPGFSVVSSVLRLSPSISWYSRISMLHPPRYVTAPVVPENVAGLVTGPTARLALLSPNPAPLPAAALSLETKAKLYTADMNGGCSPQLGHCIVATNNLQ